MRSGQRGFTLLEAIVALVLIASTGIAIFAWINTSMISLNRVQHSQVRDQALRHALGVLGTINPMEESRGERDDDAYRVRWTSSLVEPERDGVGIRNGPSVFRLGLYQMELEVQVKDGGEVFHFSARRVGYRKTREYQPDA